MSVRRLLLLLTLAIGVAFAQPASGEHPDDKAHAEEKSNPNEIYWKWANFAILVAVVGYLANKNLGAYFAARNAEIQKGITEAAEMKADVAKRTAAMEARFANLEADIDKLRQDARAEMQHEAERIEQETAQLAAKIHAQAEQEIASMTALARQELRAYSADLALSLAEELIRRQLNPELQGQLVQRFGGELSKLRRVQ